MNSSNFKFSRITRLELRVTKRDANFQTDARVMQTQINPRHKCDSCRQLQAGVGKVNDKKKDERGMKTIKPKH